MADKRKKREHDSNVTAFRIVRQATEEADEPDQQQEQADADAKAIAEGKNPAAVALGRLGGKKGGKARAEKLTPEQRREIAKKAAAARWAKDD